MRPDGWFQGISGFHSPAATTSWLGVDFRAAQPEWRQPASSIPVPLFMLLGRTEGEKACQRARRWAAASCNHYKLVPP